MTASDKCNYTIETANPALKEALRAMPDMGVHESNPYLQDMDYKSENASFKWLLDKDQNGRIYLNGQVMKFNGGLSSSNTWDTLPNLTISLNQEYQITLDRKPFDKYDLKNLLRPAVQEMSTENIIEQLNKSKALWTSAEALENDKSGALILVELMADILAYRGDYSKAHSTQQFGEHYYKDYSVSGSQIDDLKKEGKSIVPSYMRALGFPAASSLIDKTEKIRSEELASKSSYEITRAAKDGVLVSSIKPQLESKSSEAFFTSFQEFLQNYDFRMDDSDNARTKIFVKLPDLESVLISHPLNNFNENSREQVFLLKLRGFIEEGLKQGHLSDKDLLIADKDYVYKFGLDKDYITGCKQLILKAYDENTEMYRSSISEKQLLIDFGIKGLLNESKPLELRETHPETEVREIQVQAEPLQEASDNELQEKKGGLGLLAGIGALTATVVLGLVTVPNWFSQPNRVVDQSNERTPDEHVENSQNNKTLNDFLNKHGIPSIKNSNEISKGIDGLISSQTTANVRFSRQQSINDYTGEVPGHGGHNVENLELKTKTEAETQKIEILSKYIKLSTGLDINPESILVYTGDGALGLNWNKCSQIGLHREILKEDFYTALKVMNHEMAHCASGSNGHDLKFRHANEAITIAQLKYSDRISSSLNDGQSLTPEQEALLDLQKLYDRL